MVSFIKKIRGPQNTFLRSIYLCNDDDDNNNNNYNLIEISINIFMCLNQQPVADYRVSMKQKTKALRQHKTKQKSELKGSGWRSN
jgi:hypothetical protein